MTFFCDKNLGSDLTTDMILGENPVVWCPPNCDLASFTKDDMFLDLDDSETRDDSESDKRVVGKCKCPKNAQVPSNIYCLSDD